MLERGIDDKLNLIESSLYSCSEGEVTLEETKAGGEAKVKFILNNSCIAFFHMESNKPKYFKCKNCSDNIVFEKINDSEWKLHVIELKRTVKLKEWEKIKEQFKGAILNAKALSGVLEIKIKEIICYTGFRRDCLGKELVDLKTFIGLEASQTPYIEWDSGRVHIDLDSKLVLRHQKIQLDAETGEAELRV